MSSGQRTDKVARLIQNEMADVFLFEGKELLSNKFITISGVKVTPDLGEAWIYISFMDKDKQPVLEQVESHNKEFRQMLAQRIRKQVRIIPVLKFYIDDSLEYVEKMENIFKNLDIPSADKDYHMDGYKDPDSK